MSVSSPTFSRHCLRGAAIGVLVLALAVGLVACKRGDAAGKSDGQAEKVEAVPVEAVRVAQRTMTASYTGTAALEARGESQVVARTSGVALRVLAEEGQQVRAGQPLARLDPARASLQVTQSNAQVAKLEANYRRAVQLAEQKMVSANDVDQLRFDLQNARATNQMARLELSYTTVVAPISGVIASKTVKPGNFVQINSPIFRIVDTSRLEATLNVPERDIDRIKPGLPVQLAVDALPGRGFAGQVDRVAPVVDAGSGTFRVICGFEGGGSLQPGMFGRMAINYDQRADVPAIPRVALLDDGSEPAVYVVRAGKAERVPVKLGYADGAYVEVREGLKLGEQVVTAGKSALREGGAVQVIDPNAPARTGVAAPAASAK
ncbi:efflux RND transporter periplasmic adaptor subunit [Lysobacter pythonis]|uniref:Efflux RND transporter periplasmic adaptor subunit n=1 Tax=Solilutibacter pythonis TaxID=2483112 RepID=A0A3M2I942_9GAMM|nr:efflux RND transporter periplasmic adaptor subunit [Lysobacter pythonis]RMH94824.1 efflux RND transporter periplasmic adaptor subunit [Lysobacter pythonis]